MTTTAELADQAADIIRELVHRTILSGEVRIPEAYRILHRLSDLADDLPQLLQQLSAALIAREELGGLGLDDAGADRYVTTGAAVASAQLALADASTAAEGVGRNVLEALHVVSTIYDTHGLNDEE